jgi:hypothetical protein
MDIGDRPQGALSGVSGKKQICRCCRIATGIGPRWPDRLKQNIATRMGILSRRIARLADFCHLTGAEPVFSR